jgi:predicted RNase H-like HicB family nuclease
MIELEYTLIIEATEEPDYFGFYSPELEGFTGSGNSIEDCIYKAKWAIKDHVETMKNLGLKIPEKSKNPKIIIQNEEALVPV